MGLTLIECAAGLVLAALTLRDVFDTVVVPGGTRGLLRVPRRLVFGTLPLWKRIRQRPIAVAFAPVMLAGSFVVWMLLLLLAFGLLVHGLSASFQPHVQNLGQALYLAGGAMVTIGLGAVEPATGAARAVTVGAGLCGLSVMTLAVTYLLEVQSNMAQRDTGVLKLSTTAGQPPSAIVLLERYAQLGCRDELVPYLREGRDWCAAVLQSHASHPSLIYFRSAGTGSGWPATVGVLIDLGLILEQLVEEPAAAGAAVLAREQADRLACELASQQQLEVAETPVSDAQLDALMGRLAAAGYRLRTPLDRGRFQQARARHAAPSDALSRHLCTQAAPLV
jgi:hypothetical protein